MSSTLKSLLRLVEEFCVGGGEVDERVDTLVLRGVFRDHANQAEWVNLRSAPPSEVASIQIYDSEISGDLGDGERFESRRELNVTVVKRNRPHVAEFFFQSSLRDYFKEPTPAQEVRVADLEENGDFQTQGMTVSNWLTSGEAITSRGSMPSSLDPRKLVRDYVPGGVVVPDLSPWLILKMPAVPTKAFYSWRKQSSRRLLASVVSSVSADEAGKILLHCIGPPIFRIELDSQEVPAAWQEITAAAAWVYLSGFDQEARQVIFSAELARTGHQQGTLSDQVARAIEASKAAYEAHVQSTSRETLRALADLRRTTIEETQKVSQRAQDLAAALWRDLAVAASPFLFKALSDASKINVASFTKWLYLASAVFVALSFLMQLYTNRAYFAAQRQSRQQWLATLQSYISPKERDEIAVRPLETALKNYRNTAIIVGVISASLVGGLIYFGFLGQVPAAPLQPEPPL